MASVVPPVVQQSPGLRHILTELSPSPRNRGNHIQNMLRVSDVLTPSPEEQVIKIRGRRTSNASNLSFDEVDGLPDLWTDEDASTPSSIPAKAPQNSRKRLVMSPVRRSPRKSPWNSRVAAPSPLKIVGRNLTQELLSPPQSPKRARVVKKKTALATCLKALNLDQVTQLMLNLVMKHPDLEEEIRGSMPVPDLQPLEDKLNYLEKNIFKSFPNTRWGSNRDAFCYRRVRTHLEAFKKACSDQGRALVQSQSWDSVIAYTLMAWYYINRLPSWENADHNKSKLQCFRNLSGQCMSAVKKAGWSHNKSIVIKEKMLTLKEYSDEIGPVIDQIDKMLPQLS